ncbi:MAG: DUF4386 domain-containing protein [Candidatus Baltobacteraceae bacterium]
MASKEGLTLRQAAVIAGFAYLLNPVPYAEFSIYSRLVVPGHVDHSVANIAAHPGLFVAAIFCYLINFIGDVVIAWALYFLLAPVNRALSLLAALFRLVYTAIALVGTFDLVTVYRMVTTPEFAALFGSRQFYAQVDLLLHQFRYDWNLSLALFGVHLVIVGWLVFRSSYIPKILGIIVAIVGLSWVINGVQPYLWPKADLGFIFVLAFGELIFALWLLIMGWRIKEPET